MPDFGLITQQIAEQKIEEAQREGQFDNLPGTGKPLELEDLSHLPPELRVTYKILKNSGYVSPETQDRKEIDNILEMLDNTTDEKERYQQVQKLNFLVMKINEQRKTPVNLEIDQVYYQKVLDKVEVNRNS